MRDWEAGWKAVDWMIKWQTKHVAWWDEHVQKKGKDVGRGRKIDVADHRLLISVAKAEAETGISKQQVSTWGNGLKRSLYREKLFKPSHKKAMADAERHAELQTGEMEWFTPAEYVERARRVRS